MSAAATLEQRDGAWLWSAGDAHALFTSRTHGNLGLHVGDDAAAVLERRANVVDLAGLDDLQVAGVTQVHGADVWLDLARDGGTPVDPAVQWLAGPSTLEADALVTGRAGVGLAVGVADCMPIVIAWGSGVAAIHAGWRSLEGGVIENAFAALRRVAGAAVAIADAPPRAMIGPCLRACCMEVGEEVADRFPASSIVRRDGAPRPFLDAPADARRRLEALGAVVDSIDVCTMSDPSHGLYSHRRDAGVDPGRQVVLAWRSTD